MSGGLSRALESKGMKDDGCRASCVDWYGNSQPLFLRGRLIPLLGYKRVEGALEKGQIYETRRVNYASSFDGVTCFSAYPQSMQQDS